MTSPTEIKQALNDLESISILNKAEIAQYMSLQKQIENEIIEKTDSNCPYATMENRKITQEEANRAVQEGYDDATLLQTLMCMNNISVMIPRSAGGVANYKVRNFIYQLSQTGSPSASGIAMNTLIETKLQPPPNMKDNAFIIKAPNGIYRNDDPVHEYFVGAFGTNALRDFIPNFAFVMGMFKCSPPYPDSKRIYTFCQNTDENNLVNYLIYENVTNSVSFYDFIQTHSFEDFLNVFTQLVFAIAFAYQQCDFTHYDLHSTNILVKSLPAEIAIPYTLMVEGEQKTYYLVTKYVATIIDFGKSHIKYNGNDFGYNAMYVNILPNRSYPIHDIFKILCFSLFDMVSENLDEIQNNMQNIIGQFDDNLLGNYGLRRNNKYFKARNMLRFFYNGFNLSDDGDVTNGIQYVLQLLDDRFSFPFITDYNITPAIFYEAVIKTLYPDIVFKFVFDSAPAGVKLYGCSLNGTCKNLPDVLRDYTRSVDADINNPYAFYERYITIKNDFTQVVELQQLINLGKQNFFDYCNTLIEDHERLLYTFSNMASTTPKVYSLENVNDIRVKFGTQFLSLYRTYVINIVKQAELMTTILDVESIYRTLVKLFPEQAETVVKAPNGTEMPYRDIPSKAFFENMKNIVALNKKIRQIQIDQQSLRRLTKQDKELIKEINPNTSWLFDSFPWIQKAIAPQ